MWAMVNSVIHVGRAAPIYVDDGFFYVDDFPSPACSAPASHLASLCSIARDHGPALLYMLHAWDLHTNICKKVLCCAA
jgi:hypothetical protein